MKLSLAQLKTHLQKKKLANIYMVSGDELLLKQDSILLIKNAAKEAGFTEQIHLTPETNTDWEIVYTSLYSISLMPEKRCIQLTCSIIPLSKMVNELLQNYIEHPCSNQIIVIETAKLDSKTTQQSWYQALQKLGILIQVWPITQDVLPQWIIQRAKAEHQLTIQPDAACLIADSVEGNLIAAAQILEKIFLLKVTSPITSSIVTTLLAEDNRFTVFHCIDYLVSEDTKRTLHTLTSLQTAGMDITLLVWAIARELRLLATFKQQLAEKQPYDTLFFKNKIPQYRQPAIRRFLSKHSAKHCWQQLIHLAEIDRMAKGATTRDAWQALQIFCLRLTQS